MTAEEKTIAFVRGLQEELINSNHSGFYILPELLGVAHHSFMVGYNEAMRWRDPEEELPSDHALVFVKFNSFIKGEYNYDSDFIMTDDTGYKYFSIYGETVIGWRPIE